MWGDDRRLLAAALLLLLLLLLLARCNSDAINCTPYKGIRGEDITLPPNVTGNLSEIIWKKEVNTQFDKVAEWDYKLTSYSRWKNRTDIDPTSGNLTIKTISQIDDGKYQAEALVHGIFQLTYRYLCLKTLEPPSAPNLTCNIDDDGIYANCVSVTGYELPLSFSWSDINDIRIVNTTERHSRVTLLKNTDRSRNITCTIVASKSHVSSTISLKTCDSRGAVSQERTRIIPAILIPVILIICGIVAFILLKRGICRRPRGEGNQCAQLSNTEDIPERHQGENDHLLERFPENEPSREVHPANHTNESKPSDERRSEPEHRETSSIEVHSENPADECLPLNEAGIELQTMNTSSAEGVTTPES